MIQSQQLTDGNCPAATGYLSNYISPKNRKPAFFFKHLSRFAKHFQDLGIVSGWFFIRYLDHSPHIRVRFRSEKEKDKMLATPIRPFMTGPFYFYKIN